MNIFILPDKRLIASNIFDEEVGLYKNTVPVNGWRGQPEDSATENKPPQQGKGEKVW